MKTEKLIELIEYLSGMLIGVILMVLYLVLK